METFDKGFSRFEKKIDLSSIEKMLKNAYLEGYVQRLKVEDELRKNPVLTNPETPAFRNWYKFNHGASKLEDRSLGEYSSGHTIDWYKAMAIPFCKMPTKEQMMKLLDGSSVHFCFNIGTLNKRAMWNPRVEVRHGNDVVSFYQLVPHLRGKIIWDSNSVLVWLADEVDEKKALAAVFDFKVPKEERKTGDYQFPVTGIRYVEMDKEALLSAHFMSCKLEKSDIENVMNYVEE